MAVYKEYIDPARGAEVEVFLGLIRADAGPRSIERISDLVESGTVDWRFVSGLIENHLVWAVFYRNIKKAGLLPFLPECSQKELFDRYVAVVGNNLRLCRKLENILDLFESRGIPVVPFKGPLLAHDLYGDETLRFYQDLDVLVPVNRVKVARDALLEVGFSPTVQGLSGKRFGQVLAYGRECHFTDASGTVQIDLHWQLGGPFRHPYGYGFCKARLEKIRWQDRTIDSLSAEDTLLHLCVNGAHDLWPRLEQILSLADFIDGHPRLDWDLVRALASDLRCRRMLFLGLFLAADMFEAALPRELVTRVKNDRAIEKLAQTIYTQMFRSTPRESYFEKRVGQLPCQLKIREHSVDKLLYLVRRIFVPTQKDWQNRSLRSRPAGFYFLSRPIDLTVELLRALRN